MIQRRNSNSSLYAKLPWLKDCTKLLGSLRSAYVLVCGVPALNDPERNNQCTVDFKSIKEDK